MNRLPKLLTGWLRSLALLALLAAICPLAPVGLGALMAGEVDSEQMPGESEELPDGTTLSLSENSVEFQQRRARRGGNSQTADPLAAHTSRRPANQELRSNSECDCFSLPLRC